jgi:hypothetical protein
MIWKPGRSQFNPDQLRNPPHRQHEPNRDRPPTPQALLATYLAKTGLKVHPRSHAPICVLSAFDAQGYRASGNSNGDGGFARPRLKDGLCPTTFLTDVLIGWEGA